jgi:hypothetical protein
MIELQCDHWVVRHNTIYNMGGDGIRNGNDQSEANPVYNGDAVNNQYLNNTIYRGGIQGLNVRNGANVTIKHNVVSGSSTAQIIVGPHAVTDGGHTINHNVYWDADGGNQVGRWGDFITRDFPEWKVACGGCDANSLNTDPRFVSTTLGSEDFALQAGSPAIGAGEGGVALGASQDGTTPPMLEPPPRPPAHATTSAPTIVSLDPSRGPVGRRVLLRGSNFTPANNTVQFGRGYLTNLPSFHGGTLIEFRVPEFLNPCPPDAEACLHVVMSTTPQTYGVIVENSHGRSTPHLFAVVGGGD